MRTFRNIVAVLAVLAVTYGVVVSAGASAQADGGPTPSNWHCC